MSKFTPGSLDDFLWNIWDFNSESGEWPEYREKIGALIRARDREIVEECKENIKKYCWDSRLDSVLDSVLRDLG